MFVGRGFFFQAEDGIRDTSVTGVQTCALPIFGQLLADRKVAGLVAEEAIGPLQMNRGRIVQPGLDAGRGQRSEERRVGKEGRGRPCTEDRKERRATQRYTKTE